MSSRAAWLLRRKRSRTDGSTCTLGTIFFGARARFVLGDGSMKLVINHRANQPRVMFSTGDTGLSRNETEIAGKYTSLVMHRCSRHCPTLHVPGCGCQFSCSGVSPVTNSLACWPDASNSAISRVDHAGKAMPVWGVIRQVYLA